MNPTKEPYSFWSDDFDTDLLKVFPDLRERIGATADIPLWTFGHTTHGRLNHPSCWNTYGGLAAFFFLHQPTEIPRDNHGWINFNGMVTNDPLVQCSWIEAIRDAWPHAYVLTVDGASVFAMQTLWGEFQSIMYDIRGVRKLAHGAGKARKTAWSAIAIANNKFARLVEIHRVGSGVKYPHFAAGSG